MKPWQILVCGIVFGILAAGLILLIIAPPIGEPIHLIPPPTADVMIVHVDGAVNQPGVYPMAPGSRVNDAIQAAGGLLANADPDFINLAEPLHDGMKVRVYTLSEKIALQATQPIDAHSITEATGTPLSYPLDLNRASQAELESLPGIGATRAQAIIAYREVNGPFKTISDVQNVEGIGPGLFEDIKAYLTITAEGSAP